MYSVITSPRFHAFADDGSPLAAGKVYFYEAGTLSSKIVYSDAYGQVEHPQPIILDANGEAVIYGSGLFKIILEDADGVNKWTHDNIEYYTVAEFGKQLIQQVSATAVRELIEVDTSKLHTHSTDRKPVETADGNRTGFSTSYYFKPNTLDVYVNGVLQERDSSYTEDADLKGYNFTYAPQPGWEIQHRYIVDD